MSTLRQASLPLALARPRRGPPAWLIALALAALALAPRCLGLSGVTYLFAGAVECGSMAAGSVRERSETYATPYDTLAACGRFYNRVYCEDELTA